jgi:hypothetical protein
MNRRTPQRAIALSFFIAAISFFNFSRLQGSECIRAIHVLTLLVCGAAIGVALSSLFTLLRNKTQ